MKKNIQSVLLVSAGIMVLLFLIIPALYTPTVKAPYPQTYGSLKRLGFWVKQSELDNKTSIVDLIRDAAVSSEFNLREQFFHMLQNDLGIDNDSLSIIEKSKKDGWGIPFNIDYTTNISGLSKELFNSLSTCSIVIWSNGPNHEDEKCLGDDIPWPISELELHLDEYLELLRKRR